MPTKKQKEDKKFALLRDISLEFARNMDDAGMSLEDACFAIDKLLQSSLLSFEPEVRQECAEIYIETIKEALKGGLN